METRALPSDSSGGSCFSPVGRGVKGADRECLRCHVSTATLVCVAWRGSVEGLL